MGPALQTILIAARPLLKLTTNGMFLSSRSRKKASCKKVMQHATGSDPADLYLRTSSSASYSSSSLVFCFVLLLFFYLLLPLLPPPSFSSFPPPLILPFSSSSLVFCFVVLLLLQTKDVSSESVLLLSPRLCSESIPKSVIQLPAVLWFTTASLLY